MRLQLELDKHMSIKLVEQSVAEKRPVSWQAELLLRRALGLTSRHHVQEPSEQGEPRRAGPESGNTVETDS